MLEEAKMAFSAALIFTSILVSDQYLLTFHHVFLLFLLRLQSLFVLLA